LFQVSQLPLSYILLFDVSKNLLYFVFKHPIASEYFLGRFSSQYVDLSIAILVYHKVLDINLNLVENYSPEVTNRINYLGYFCSEQVLVEENINIHQYKKGIKLASVLIIKV
jgi:hypothetical protein